MHWWPATQPCGAAPVRPFIRSRTAFSTCGQPSSTRTNEEAAPDGIQTADRLSAWCHAANIDPHVGYSCYVLPHVLALLPPRVIEGVLRATDALFGWSVIRTWAGVIYVAGRRRDDTTPSPQRIVSTSSG